MKTICLYFEIHQIIHLRRYRFFDIGTDHYYYDDYENERSITDIVQRSYVPALDTLLQMIKDSNGYFKVALCLSGVGIESLEKYAPEVIEKVQELAKTGCVEFLAEPYSHGLASLGNEDSFKAEVKRQSKKIKEYFGYTPKVQLVAYIQRRDRANGCRDEVQGNDYGRCKTRIGLAQSALSLPLCTRTAAETNPARCKPERRYFAPLQQLGVGGVSTVCRQLH